MLDEDRDGIPDEKFGQQFTLIINEVWSGGTRVMHEPEPSGGATIATGDFARRAIPDQLLSTTSMRNSGSKGCWPRSPLNERDQQHERAQCLFSKICRKPNIMLDGVCRISCTNC